MERVDVRSGDRGCVPVLIKVLNGEQYTIGVSGLLLIKQVRSKIKLSQARELRPPSLFMNQAIGISFKSLECII